MRRRTLTNPVVVEKLLPVPNHISARYSLLNGRTACPGCLAITSVYFSAVAS